MTFYVLCGMRYCFSTVKVSRFEQNSLDNAVLPQYWVPNKKKDEKAQERISSWEGNQILPFV